MNSIELKREPSSAPEFAGLLKSATARLTDAQCDALKLPWRLSGTCPMARLQRPPLGPRVLPSSSTLRPAAASCARWCASNRPLAAWIAFRRGLAPCQLRGQLIAAALGAVFAVLDRVCISDLAPKLLNLSGQSLFVLTHAPVAHGFVLARVGTHLGAVYPHAPELDQARLARMLHHLCTQRRVFGHMQTSKLAQRAVRGPIARSQYTKCNVLLQAPAILREENMPLV